MKTAVIYLFDGKASNFYSLSLLSSLKASSWWGFDRTNCVYTLASCMHWSSVLAIFFKGWSTLMCVPSLHKKHTTMVELLSIWTMSRQMTIFHRYKRFGQHCVSWTNNCKQGGEHCYLALATVIDLKNGVSCSQVHCMTAFLLICVIKYVYSKYAWNMLRHSLSHLWEREYTDIYYLSFVYVVHSIVSLQYNWSQLVKNYEWNVLIRRMQFSFQRHGCRIGAGWCRPLSEGSSREPSRFYRCMLCLLQDMNRHLCVFPSECVCIGRVYVKSHEIVFN